jgi:aspartate/methionine/tyrosine aminotransferase
MKAIRPAPSHDRDTQQRSDEPDRSSAAIFRTSWIHSGPGVSYKGRLSAQSLGRGTPGFYGPASPSPEEPLHCSAFSLEGRPIKYPATAGEPDLRKLVAQYCSNFGFLCSPDDIILCNGGTQAILLSLLYLHQSFPNSLRCGFFTPTWLTLPLNQLSLLGGTHIEIPSLLGSSNTWDLDRDLVCDLCARGAINMAFVVNPSNPTGSLIDPEVFSTLSAHRIPTVLDVTYESMLYNPPIELFSGVERSNTFLVGSLSKTFAVPGIRLGFLVPPPTALANCIRIMEAVSLGISALSQAFARQCLTHWIESRGTCFLPVIGELKRRRALTTQILSGCGFRIAPPSGGYYTFAELPPAWIGQAVSFCRSLYSQSCVELVPGPEFGDEYASFVRISFANPATYNDLKEALLRIDNFVTEMNIRETILQAAGTIGFPIL